MVKQNQKRRLISVLASLLLALTGLSAQQQTEQADSLVRLMSADWVRQTEIGDDVVRKVMNPVFLHNGTYLTCDSSVWSANNQIIHFYGNVKMMQGDTELTSEKLDYLIEEDLAQFRGVLVQLRNKQNNILRTKHLDYNTKDSVAVFQNGASMISEDGQIIESREGSYFNAKNLFNFKGNVNMFADSVFVKTQSLDYDSDAEKAYFTSQIHFWKDDNILSANAGWYNKLEELFFFEDKVHGVSKDQETWSDSLYFYRNHNDVLMRNNVQLQDTTRSVTAVSNYFYYQDALSQVTMRDKAAVAMWSEKEGQRDTTYFGADLFVLHTERKCDVDSLERVNAESRLSTISADPVAEYRKRVAEEYAASRRDALGESESTSDQGGLMQAAGMQMSQTPDAKLDKPELGEKPSIEDLEKELQTTEDTVATEPQVVDTTAVAFLKALGNVRVFREDMQMRCDSLLFNELDSIARLHINPIVWNEGRRQYTADSLFVLIRENGADRASLMSNAFIAVQEDETHFDQIMSTEVMAYFNEDMELRRFDALGGATALFYIEENDVLATANRVETKLMSATLKKGEVDRVYYFEQPKNDVYPLAQMPETEQRFKGLNWQPDLRPQSPLDISDLSIRPSGRFELEAQQRPIFAQTERFFPGWMSDVYKSLEDAKRRKQQRERENQAKTEPHATDSTLVFSDSLGRKDLFAIDSLAVKDSVTVADSLATDKPEEEWMSPRELRRALRIAKRDARWAELDARDAEKEALKLKKKEERQRKKAERAAKRRARQEAKDQAKLQKYIEYFEKQKEQNEREQEPDTSRERTQGTEAGGELPAAPEFERETA